MDKHHLGIGIRHVIVVPIAACCAPIVWYRLPDGRSKYGTSPVFANANQRQCPLRSSPWFPDAIPSIETPAWRENVGCRPNPGRPATVEIKVGQTVKWTNGEKRTSHSLVFLDSSGFETERLFPGESWERLFDQPGTYPYHCGPHPEMTGQVIVTD